MLQSAEPSASKRARTASDRIAPFTALGLAIPLLALALTGSLWWPGRVFPGFFVLRKNVVPTVGLYSWTGLQAAVPFHSVVVAVEDQPVETSAQVYAHAAEVGVGARVNYTFRKDGREVRIAVPTMRFGAWDFVLTFGLYLVNGILVLGAGIAVHLLQPGRIEARVFLVLGWFFGLLFLTAPALYHPTLNWILPVNLLAQAFWPATLVHLGLVFPSMPKFVERQRVWIVAPYLVAAALTVWCWIGCAATPPDFFPIWVTFLFVAFGILALGALLISSYWRDPSPLSRARLRAILPGFTLATAICLFGFLNNAQEGGTFPINLAMIFPVCFYGAIAYAIARHDLFDIDRVVKQTVVYSTLTLAITAVYATTLVILGWFPSSHVVRTSPLFNMAFVVLVAILFEPLRQRLQAFVDRLFFRAQVDYRRAVHEVSGALVSILDAEQVLLRVGTTVHEGLAPSSLAVVLWLYPGTEVWRLRPSGRLETVESPPTDGLREYLQHRPGAWAVPDADVPTDAVDAQRVATMLGAQLVLPLARGERMLGAFLLGPKRSGVAYGTTDLELLDTLAAQSAIALQNALLYGQLERLNAELEGKVQRRTSELEVSNTELTRAYRELQSTQAQLLQTEKLASLGQLVAGVAHEINTPVTAIVGNVAPLWRELGRLRDRAALHGDSMLERIADRLKAIFEVMARGAERTADIVQDLRVFSRVDETRPLPMDLHESIDVSLRLLRPRWAGRVDVHRDYGDLPPVEASAGQVNQVFMNLLVNACDAIEGAGNIWIRTECDATVARVTVRDDGCGIAPDVTGRIFDPFFTTKPIGKGTGLGLAISASIVRNHGGAIQVSSSPGAGATFVVELPLRAAIAVKVESHGARRGAG